MNLQATKTKKLFIIILAGAILFKLSIFIFGAMRVPESILDSDSEAYLVTANTIFTQGVFGVRDNGGSFRYEAFRTPGYPVFLAIFHKLTRFPLIWVIFLQLLLTILAGLITYKVAIEVDSRIGLLSMAIALFDPPTSVYSLKIMTEALFLVLLALFLYMFIKYLKSGKLSLVFLSALSLVAATYVRPVSYYLGVAAAIFVIYANVRRNLKKTILHAFIFLLIVFSFLGIWQLRNYKRAGCSSFATVATNNLRNHSLVAKVEKGKNTGLVSKGLGYLSAASSSLMNLMTLPGSLKYFNAKYFAKFSKVIFYAWMVFWLLGFLAGCINVKRNMYYQFLLWIILYFAAVTVINISDAAGERFRIPMVPSIAIISSYGWLIIKSYGVRLRNGKKHTGNS